MALDPIDLMRRFEPILLFHKDEPFFTCDAKVYIERCALWRVLGGPADSKANWGGQSPRTYPHTPMVPFQQISAAAGEPGTDINFPVNDGNTETERFLDFAGWEDGEGVDADSLNQYANLDRIARFYSHQDDPLHQSLHWYHAEIFTAERLKKLLRPGMEINLDKFAALKDPALICYYLFFPGHVEGLEGCTNDLGQHWANCAGAWACVAVLLEGDGTQNNFTPKSIGLTSRNAGAIQFLGQEQRIGMIVSDWNLVPTMVRDRGPGKAQAEHARIFVSRGTHGLYLSGGPQIVAPFSPADVSGESCGEYETLLDQQEAQAAFDADHPSYDNLFYAKTTAGAVGGFLGGAGLAGAIGGAFAGFVGAMAEALIAAGGMANLLGMQQLGEGTPSQTDHPPLANEIGIVVRPSGVTPTDVGPKDLRHWGHFRLPVDDETAISFAVTGDTGSRRYSLAVWDGGDVGSRPSWLPTDDPKEGGYRGRWGNRVVHDPCNRRVGMLFPEFWKMFFDGLGKM